MSDKTKIGRRRIGRIALLTMIETELRKRIAWIKNRDRQRDSELFRGARYAYTCAIKELRRHHVLFGCRPRGK